ncbi:MAG: hypothetical protein ACFFB8_17410 [Promethearchaeota archaeon]
MVYVVLKSFYPTHKAEEILKIFMELVKKYPPDESIAETLIRGAGRATEKGLEGMSIWKLKEGQFDKMANRIMSAMSMFNNVEGFGWRVEIWSTFEESSAIG